MARLVRISEAPSAGVTTIGAIFAPVSDAFVQGFDFGPAGHEILGLIENRKRLVPLPSHGAAGGHMPESWCAAIASGAAPPATVRFQRSPL